MAFKITVLIACFIAATVALPVDNEMEGERAYVNSEHSLSGASGTFRYPLSESVYRSNERVLITARFPEDTVFVLENYNTESGYDTINIYKWSGTDSKWSVALDKTFSGSSITPNYFLPEGNFLITFESDSSTNKIGFKLRWAPLETLLLH